MTSAWDQNAAVYATSPAAAITEEIAGEWLKQLFGLPASATFAFVTGCQMAHVTCLAAARHAILAEREWDVERCGLQGAPAIRVISSSTRHLSIDRALRLLGIGVNALVLLEPGPDEVLSASALDAALARDSEVPTIVLLQAGEINTGAFDKFEEIVPICRRYGAWVHVDGAFGLWASASDQYAHLVRGVERADSWATDGHKWLGTPFDSGYAFVRNGEAHRAAMAIRAPYITNAPDARDQLDFNPDWSRRARGFATYAAIRELGRDGIRSVVESCCENAVRIVEGIAALDRAEVLWTPVLNQGLVRFLAPESDASERDHDAYTDEVIARIVAGGEAFFGGTTWRGKRAMRVSVMNARGDRSGVDRALSAVKRALEQDKTLLHG